MSVHSDVVRDTLRKVVPRSVSGDMRRHRRLPIEIDGRFMGADRTEHACKSKDISVGGARLVTRGTANVGDRIVVYFEHLGGFDGTVSRTLPDGFAVQFKVTEHKKEKLAAQIMWLANREAYPDELGRAHERTGTGGRRTTLQLDEGIVIDVELLDLSASGASAGTAARPAIGELVQIGKIKAIVRRHHDTGVGLQFISLQTQDALRSNFP